MSTQAQIDAINAQDALRPIRSFVSLLNGLTSDQTNTSFDGMPYGSTYGYQTVGAYGTAIEGSNVPITTATVAVSNNLLWLVIGAVVFMVMK